MNGSLEVNCPKCQSDIPLEDVNVANDIALCRKCGDSFSFAEAVREEVAVPPVDLNHPPKGMVYRRTTDGFELSVSTRSIALAIFLVPFMLVWSGGSLGGIYGSQIAKGDFNLLMSLFGLPFLLGSIVLGAFTIMTLAGKFCVSAEGRQGQVFVGIGSIGYRKRFLWDAVKDIRLETRRTAKGGEYKQLVIDADTTVTIPNVNDARANFLLGALRQIREQMFPPAQGRPPRVSQVA